MRVIYATSELEDWVEVAKNMKKKQDWTPIYWITTPKNHLAIKKEFPLAICQGYIDAVRGVYTQEDKNVGTKVLDKSVITQYALYEKTALKMMDRMDPTAYAFNLSERLEMYNDFLLYWINEIVVLKPDYVLFSESPHALFQYVLYAVCIENDIKVLRFSPTHIEGLTFLSSDIEQVPEYLTKVYEDNIKNTKNKQYSISHRYLNKNRGVYQDAIPYYMKTITEKKNFQALFLMYFFKLKRFVQNPIYTAYKRANNVSLKAKIRKRDLLFYRVRGIFIKRELRNVYAKVSELVSLKEDYVYVALHYQPEKTTSPEGGLFVDQYLMISMLSARIPKGWKIYVKEHVSQFYGKLYGEQGRNKAFYEKVSNLRNVSFVKESISSFTLIDNAKAVATITGTVGIESVIRSKPLLCFGYAWYAPCHGVFNIKRVEELEEALNKIEKGYKIDSKLVDAFFYTIEEISLPTYLNPGNKIGVNFDKVQNIQNLTTLLLPYAQRV